MPAFGRDGSHNFALTTRSQETFITDGFVVDPDTNSIEFNQFNNLPNPNDRTLYYFSLPPRFRGDQVRLAASAQEKHSSFWQI